MEKNQLIELIKQNRINEALKLVEKAVEGTDLQNEVILLASTYSEYAKLNRSATEDFNTLDMQRNRIVNRLLSFLDDLPAETLQQIPTPPPVMASSSHAATPQPAFQPQSAFQAQARPGADGAPIWKKYGLYIIGGLVGLVILIGLMSGDPEEAAGDATATMEEAQTPADETLQEEESSGSSGVGVTGLEAEWFEVVAPGTSNVVEINMVDDVNWVEIVSESDQKNFVLANREEWSVYLRDDSRGVSLHLNLYDLTVTYNDANGQHFKLYDIQNAGVFTE